MDSSQWKSAGEQLLAHWRRSGIGQLPRATPDRVAVASDWLLMHESQWLQSSSVAETHSKNYLPKSSEPRSSMVPVEKISPSDSDSQLNAITPPNASKETETIVPVESSKSLPTLGAPGVWQTNKLTSDERTAVFKSLNESVVACRKCEEIVCRRSRTVFGVGPVDAKIVMFGEAPGADEDRSGEPFVGAAGQLLDKILAASGMPRESVYILNALKCRPPNNRTPVESEIDNCRPFFESQLETIQPDYIVCWGAIPVRAVLNSTDSIGRLRGRFHAYRGAKVMVTYHPAYLLRNEDAKRLTWEDMKMLMRELGIPIPSKGK
jgi:uracil-DNA glycosylase